MTGAYPNADKYEMLPVYCQYKTSLLLVFSVPKGVVTCTLPSLIATFPGTEGKRMFVQSTLVSSIAFSSYFVVV